MQQSSSICLTGPLEYSSLFCTLHLIPLIPRFSLSSFILWCSCTQTLHTHHSVSFKSSAVKAHLATKQLHSSNKCCTI
uniref:Uncharacterized protein n=1 Tax=Octopus bimaculoides TaxID=37653 RepID=A0A0L8HCM4_OCTBM